MRAPAPGRPPRAQPGDDPQHGQLTVEEDGIDREAHEEGVNRGSGAKKNSFAPLEPTTPKESLETCERCLGDETPLTEGPAILTLEG